MAVIAWIILGLARSGDGGEDVMDCAGAAAANRFRELLTASGK
jgi:hypothetical protein